MGTITITIDEQALTDAIAKAIVERSQGADRIQAIESKTVAHHVKSLLEALTPRAIELAVAEAVTKTLSTKEAPIIARINAVIDRYMNDPVYLQNDNTRVPRVDAETVRCIEVLIRSLIDQRRKAFGATIEQMFSRVKISVDGVKP